MSGDVQFVRHHPLESFLHAQKLKRMVTNKNIHWLSCACPFCPVYLLFLFAIHSLDVWGSFLLSVDVRQYSFYVHSMFGTFVSCAVFVFTLFLLFHFLSWAHSFFLLSSTRQSAVQLFENWSAGEMRSQIYLVESCMRLLMSVLCSVCLLCILYAF